MQARRLPFSIVTKRPPDKAAKRTGLQQPANFAAGSQKARKRPVCGSSRSRRLRPTLATQSSPSGERSSGKAAPGTMKRSSPRDSQTTRFWFTSTARTVLPCRSISKRSPFRVKSVWGSCAGLSCGAAGAAGGAFQDSCGSSSLASPSKARRPISSSRISCRLKRIIRVPCVSPDRPSRLNPALA